MDVLQKRLSRRQFIQVTALGTGASVLIGCMPSVTQTVGITPLGMQMMWRNDSEQANLHVAKKAGYYAEEGLAVTLHEGGGGVNEILTTLAGTDNIVVGAVSGTANMIPPVAESNLPLVIIGAMMQKKPECYLTLKKFLSDEEWAEWEETGKLSPLAMKGDVVGEGGQDRFKLAALMRSVGLTTDDITIQNTDSATALPLVTESVQWLSTWTINQPWMLKQEGLEYAYVLVSDWAVPLHGHVLFTTKERMRDKRDIIAGFLRATFRGLKRTIEDVDFAMEAVREYSGGYDEPDKWRWLITEMNAISVSEQTEKHGLGWVDKGEVQAVAEFLNKNAGTPIPDVDEIVDMSLHPGKVSI